MIKTLSNILKQDREAFVIPKKVQDMIPIQTIWPDGIFLNGKNKFSKMYRFTDINYAVASRDDKEGMFLEYSELLNSLDSGSTTKITINNRRLNRLDFEEQILIRMQEDGLNDYREEYNQMLLDKATGSNAIIQDTVNEAISRRKKIQFKYSEYGPDLKEVLRGDGEVYELSPYALLWNEDYYYVVGWSDKHNNVSVFRVDRLDRPAILDEKAVKRPEGFNLDDYSMPIFDMYEGPERVPVKLEVRNDLAKYIVDRFGTKLETKQISDDRFTVEVEVSLSPTFYAWVFQFAGGMRILKPKKAVDEIMDMVNQFVERETL